MSVVAPLLAAPPAQRVPSRRNGRGEASTAQAVPITQADMSMEEGSQETPSSQHPEMEEAQWVPQHSAHP